MKSIKSFNEFFKENTNKEANKSLEQSTKEAGYSTIKSKICIFDEIPSDLIEVSSFSYEMCKERENEIIRCDLGFKVGSKNISLEFHYGKVVISKYSLSGKIDINSDENNVDVFIISILYKICMNHSYSTGIWNSCLTLAQKLESMKKDKGSILVK